MNDDWMGHDMPNLKKSNASRFRHWLNREITWNLTIAKTLTRFEFKLMFWGTETRDMKYTQQNMIYLEQGTKKLQRAREAFMELWQQEKKKCAANGGKVNIEAWNECQYWIEQCPPDIHQSMANLGVPLDAA